MVQQHWNEPAQQPPNDTGLCLTVPSSHAPPRGEALNCVVEQICIVPHLLAA